MAVAKIIREICKLDYYYIVPVKVSRVQYRGYANVIPSDTYLPRITNFATARMSVIPYFIILLPVVPEIALFIIVLTSLIVLKTRRLAYTCINMRERSLVP